MLRQFLLNLRAAFASFGLHLLGLANPLFNHFEEIVSRAPKGFVHEEPGIVARSEFPKHAISVLL